MKDTIAVTLFLCIFAISAASAQNNNCPTLFSALTNHTVKECQTKEFEKLEVSKKEKTGVKTETKQGEYVKVAYAFAGNFNERPSEAQIYQNYVNAITKAGGEVLHNGGNGVYGKLKKGGDIYWIKIYTDGSSWYWYETIREAPMRQDVVPTAAEINNSLKDDGKVLFYGIYFDTDKSNLKSESTPTLQAMAAFLKENPAVNIYIVGHTDNSGTLEHNLTLSKERANAVVNELSTKYAINKTRLVPQGVASLAPVASNDTEAGKAKNRRVEMVKR